MGRHWREGGNGFGADTLEAAGECPECNPQFTPSWGSLIPGLAPELDLPFPSQLQEYQRPPEPILTPWDPSGEPSYRIYDTPMSVLVPEEPAGPPPPFYPTCTPC